MEFVLRKYLEYFSLLPEDYDAAVFTSDAVSNQSFGNLLASSGAAHRTTLF
jgi:hypothetical protein